MAELGLESLRPAAPAKRSKRVGRGPGSGHGKTSGKGHKGQKARSGGTKGRGFEGGQMPIQMRVPKRGFTNAPFRHRFEVVNLHQLAEWPTEVPVTSAALAAKRLVRSPEAEVKLLGRGDVASALQVDLAAVSASARSKVEAAGGRIVERPVANTARPEKRKRGTDEVSAPAADDA